MSSDVQPSQSDPRVEPVARHLAEARWSTWLHPHSWENLTEGHRDSYRDDAKAIVAVADEALRS